MTNLLIGYPDIPRAATRIRASSGASGDVFTTGTETTFSNTKPFYNILRGPRSQFAHVSTAASSFQFFYDVGPSTTKSADFLIVSMLNQLLYAGSTIDMELKSGDDGLTTGMSAVSSVADISAATLYGPESNDYYVTFATSTARRYWQVSFDKTAGSNFRLALNKVYFGTQFDMGIDPETVRMSREPDGDPSFITASGTQYLARVGKPRYAFDITWLGVSDDKVRDFDRYIAAYAHHTPVFLTTATDHSNLDGQRIVHCNLASYSTRPGGYRVDWNVIQARFEETVTEKNTQA